ncbi:protein geranylgeranyltransferase type II [Cavenderia fasciculata]|uniref:Geranylgeranyl transferase type-2 subunit beta n=1 Tax=Cavenderia fasciculata TaxID=261658 RepID=F4PL21_CACFS|nr:protein geranylgeranyltransferase type II [Cavenderia fasciculata]EGG23243.1 protein geranylgeranyltransferase type II [Cavenderia fasciculata]|eukprot:XP_004361094.1 protein geranylgeranyltransferase type II [Cavenderia fasciculata]
MSDNSNSNNNNSIDHTKNVLVEKHISYVVNLDNKKEEDFEYWVTEHLRMNGMYWGLTSLYILKALDKMDRDVIINWVLSCQKSNGGFSGNVSHDEHLLSTLSAVQILMQLDALDRLDQDLVAKYVLSLQQEDGSFFGDKWGEVDTRFTYCAVSCLSLMGKLDLLDNNRIEKIADFINRCKNFDAGYGCIPGAESHAGQTFTCVGALAIINRLDLIDRDQLGWWLCERQLPNGGLNGRPEKTSDVCYSWWVVSALSVIDRLHWIDNEKLRNYILKCQDNETGGIADKPGNVPDVFHTFFGLCGFSLMSYFDMEEIDPTYALGTKTLLKYNIKLPWNKKL